MPRKITDADPDRMRLLERRREQKKAEYQRRKETIKARNQAWRDANREICSELGRQWRSENKERKAIATRRHYERNRDEIRAREAMRTALAIKFLDADYVLQRFVAGTGLRKADIPDEMVPGIVLIAQIRREAKQRIKREKNHQR